MHELWADIGHSVWGIHAGKGMKHCLSWTREHRAEGKSSVRQPAGQKLAAGQLQHPEQGQVESWALGWKAGLKPRVIPMPAKVSTNGII